MHYVVLTPEVIGEVMNGQRTTLPVMLPAEVGATIGLKTGPDKKPTCLMDVTACDPDPDGYTIRLRPHVYEHKPMLLRAGSPLTGGGKARLMSAKKRRFRNPKAKAPEERNWSEEIARGYTSNPALSLAGEPEGVDWGDLNIRWTMRAGKRYEIALIERDELRRRARELLTVEERMRVAREAARFNHIDVRDEFKALRHMQRRGRSEVTVIRELERIERIAHRDAA